MKSKVFAIIAPTALFAAGIFIIPTFSTGSVNAKNTDQPITFSKEIAPIFYKNCAECHRPGEAAPFSILTYKDVRPWAKSIKDKVAKREMPPWHADPHVQSFSNDRRMSLSDIE